MVSEVRKKTLYILAFLTACLVLAYLNGAFRKYPWPLVPYNEPGGMYDYITSAPIRMTVVEGSLSRRGAVFQVGNPTEKGLNYDGLYYIDVDNRWHGIDLGGIPRASGLAPYRTPPNSDIMIAIDWGELYGKLPSGKYRLGKHFQFYKPDYSAGDSFITYCEFTID